MKSMLYFLMVALVFAQDKASNPFAGILRRTDASTRVFVSGKAPLGLTAAENGYMQWEKIDLVDIEVSRIHQAELFEMLAAVRGSRPTKNDQYSWSSTALDLKVVSAENTINIRIVAAKVLLNGRVRWVSETPDLAKMIALFLEKKGYGVTRRTFIEQPPGP